MRTELRFIAFVPLFLVLPVVADDAVVAGRLCLLEGKQPANVAECSEVRGRRIDVAPDSASRRFAWLRSDGKEFIIGHIDKEGTRIDLDGATGIVRARILGSADRGWPAPIHLEITSKADTWNLSLPPVAATQLREIRLPQETYAVKWEADHHQPFRLKPTKIAAEPVDLGMLTLEPLPRFIASVRNEEGTVLSGASLLDDYGKLLATADHLGRIAFEAECGPRGCHLPQRVTIEYPGLAGARVLVTSERGDFDAGTITLGAGGSLEVVVKRPEGQQFPVDAEITEALANDPHTARVIEKKTIAADADRVRFDRLPTGRSGLYLRGPEKTHVMSSYVTIDRDKVTQHEFQIQPTEVTIHVLKGGAAVSGAEVEIGVPHGKPDYDVALAPTNSEGKVSTTVWETETMVAGATVGDIRETVFFRIIGSARQDVQIVISPTVLRGRVFDADSGEPLNSASVGYKWEGKHGQSFSSVNTDENGRYELLGARPGKHTLHFQEQGFLAAEASVETTGNENERTLDLALSRGRAHKVKLQWSDGAPVAGARIVQVIESTRRYQDWTSDVSGEFTAPMVKGRVIEVWIAPKEGSFAFATLDGSREDTTVRIPRSAGTMLIRAVDPSGRPAPSTHLAFRYEGRRVDYYVIEMISSAHGTRFKTGSDGTVALRGLPPGTYELWGIQYDGDDLIVGEPRKQRVTSVYYAGGDLTVTVEPHTFGVRGPTSPK